ncbi:MAG TPA: 2-C-methyl-D-erythritol 4-phosphate cytidylyltransferase, partial [Solirubrobacterales bacterium]
MEVTAVIAAAGSGERLGAGGPKAFVPLGGRPMIAWSLDACLACGPVATVVVAVPAGHDHGLDGVEGIVTVDGGATRAASVAAALSVVATEY